MAAESLQVLPPSDVVLVSNGFQSEYEVGVANGLCRLGLKPLLVCSHRLDCARLDAGVTVSPLRGTQDPRRSRLAKAVNLLRYWRDLASLLLRHRGRPVHLIGLFSLPGPLAAVVESVALRLLATRFVLTVHNLLPHDRHGIANRLAYRWVYRQPAVLMVHTQRMRAELQRRFDVPAERIVVCEHGIDRVLPLPANERSRWLRDRCGLAPEVPVVLFFGNIAPYKGLDLLLAAFKRLQRDAHLVIAGDCRSAALRAALSPSISALVEQRRATWHDGFVAESDVAHYFHGADLLVMPYRHIDQSGILFLALSTGLPVLASDVGSLRDYVPGTGGRVVAPDSVDALLNGLEAMLAAVATVDRNLAIARSRHFAWQETLRPLLPAYAPGSSLR